MYSIEKELKILRQFVKPEHMDTSEGWHCYSEDEVSAAEERLHTKLPPPIREIYLYMADLLIGSNDLRPLELLHWDKDYLAFFENPDADVIAGIKDEVTDDQIVITIAPGKTLSWLADQFGRAVKIVRTMPNTPAMVGEGMTAACPNEHMTEEEIGRVKEILESFSRVELVPEKLMDVVTAVSGSSPAYVFMFIEAMADAAVSGGMPRAQAYQFAAQAVLGSAKMVLDTGKHPGELKDMVCSPAGTTIGAVRTLEEKGFRSAVFEAVKVCEEISRSL